MACGSTMNTRDLVRCTVIKFLTKEAKKPKEIHERMNAVYGDVSPSYYQVKFWSKQFKWSRESIEGDSRSGRPVEASSKEICQKVKDMILQDRRVKISVIAHELGFQLAEFPVAYHPFSLDYVKGYFPMVIRMLIPEQKVCRQQFSKENLDMLRINPENVFSRINTGNETWVHQHDPETKHESTQWKHKESPTPKKFRVQQSAGKIIVTVFWDSEGVLLLEFMPHKTTITGDTYASTMVTLQEDIEQKHRAKLSAGVLLLHDNAPAHHGCYKEM